MENTVMSKSLEDYLETLFILAQEKKVVRVKDMTENMNVKTSSVNKAMKVLADAGFVYHEKYGYIELTESGFQEGEKIYKKHVMLRRFLSEILNVSDNVAEHDACAIEHCLSEETYENMVRFLNSYRRDP